MFCRWMEERSMVNEYIRNIKIASKNGKLTFFVGAGLSKLSDYPDWKELTNKFSEKLGLPIKDENSNYSNEEYLSIPQKYYYSIDKDENVYYELLEEQLNRDDIKPNLIHDLVLMLKPANIITTNFDDLIEKAVSKQGLFYDVIASDSDVSNTKNSKFILKAHGDLKNRNIVLKEEDYLNYSENFKLIETLIKSIFSTNVVVFVGYTLGDYNMKLILNWVRNLQGDDFKTPYFLYLGNEKLNPLDITYYESRGLKIIDYKEFSDVQEDWLLRYKVVLKEILECEETQLSIQDAESLDYLYELLLPLCELNVLRREDVASKIKGDYTVGDDGVIWKYNPQAKYIENFNRVHMNYKSESLEKVEEGLIEKYNVIKDVLRRAYIYGYKNSMLFRYEFDYMLENTTSLSLDYKLMEDFANGDYESSVDNYIKAYFLFKLGRFKDSYYLYTTVAQKYFEDKNYMLYFLSQSNRYSAYRAIKAIGDYSKTIAGALTGYDNSHNELSEDDELIMKEFDLDEVYNSLTLEFRNINSSFKDLYNSNYLNKNIYKIVKQINKVEKAVKAKSFESGFTSIDSLFGMINPQLYFVFGNYLVVDEYDEFKLMVKEATKAMLYKYSNDSYEYFSEHELYEVRKQSSGVKLNRINFTCMLQYFTNNELKEVFNDHGIRKLDFEDLNECIKVVRNIIEYYKMKKSNFESGYLYQKISQYINNALYILKYVELPVEVYTYIVSEVFCIDNHTLNIGNKIMFLDKQQAINKFIDGNVTHVIEKEIVNYLEKRIHCIKNEEIFDESSFNGMFHSSLTNYLVANDDRFKSSQVSLIIEEIIDDNIEMRVGELIHFAPILCEGTILKLTNLARKALKEKFDFKLLRKMIENSLLNSAQEYQSEIQSELHYNIDKLKLLKEKHEKEEKKDDEGNIKQSTLDRIIEIGDIDKNIKDTLECLGYWIFIGILKEFEVKDFLGRSDEFDFFSDMDTFEYEKFDPSWLNKFNVIEAHRNISNNEKAKVHIKELLEKFLKKPDFDFNQKKWLLRLYLEVYNA